MIVEKHDTSLSHKDTWNLMLLESFDVDFFLESVILVFRLLERTVKVKWEGTYEWFMLSQQTWWIRYQLTVYSVHACEQQHSPHIGTKVLFLARTVLCPDRRQAKACWEKH